MLSTKQGNREEKQARMRSHACTHTREIRKQETQHEIMKGVSRIVVKRAAWVTAVLKGNMTDST